MSRLAAAACCLALASVVGCSRRSDEVSGPGHPRALHGSALVIAEHLEPIPDSVAWFTDDEGFHRHFERLGRLTMPEDVPFAMMRPPVVASDGRMILADPSQRVALLLAPDGSLIAELSADACDPGYSWSPMIEFFFADGTFVVWSASGDPPLLFDREGRCASKLDGSPFVRQAVPAVGRSMAVYVPAPEEYSIEWRTPGATEGRTVYTGNELARLLRRLALESMVADPEGRVYLLTAGRAAVVVVDSTGHEYPELNGAPPYFQPILEDIPPGLGFQEFLEAERSIMEHKTPPVALSLLDHDRLLLQFFIQDEDHLTSPRARGIHVISTSGEVLTPEPILTPSYRQSISAADGLVYMFDWDHPTTEGPYGNPSLVVFRFVE